MRMSIKVKNIDMLVSERSFHVQSGENRTTATLNPLCASNGEDLSLAGIPTVDRVIDLAVSTWNTC